MVGFLRQTHGFITIIAKKYNMNYEHIWKKTLNDSEKVEYEFSIASRHRKLVLIIWLFFGVITLIMPSLGLPLIIIGIIHYWYLGLNAYALTSERVLIHTGWISTQSTSIGYDKIVEVSIQEPFLNRVITKSGNLVIKTAGLGHDVILRNIQTPYEVKKTLDRLSHHGKNASHKISGEHKSVSVELVELFKLKEQGVITEEEFNGHKAKILK